MLHFHRQQFAKTFLSFVFCLALLATASHALTSLVIDNTVTTLGGNLNYDIIEIKNNGVLQVDPSIGWIRITAFNITIDATSKIIADKLCIPGGAGGISS